MKKLITIFTVFFSLAAVAQDVYFSEDFESVAIPNLPVGMTSTTASAEGYGWLTAEGPYVTNGAFLDNGNFIVSHNIDTNTFAPYAGHNEFITIGPIDLSAVSGDPVFVQWLAASRIYFEGAAFESHYNVHVTTSSDFGVIAASVPVLETFVKASLNDQFEMLDISSFAGESEVYITFRHYENPDVTGYGLLLDEIKVLTPKEKDVALLNYTLYPYSLVGETEDLKLRVRNVGSETVNTLKLNWNDGTPHSEDFTVTLAPGAEITLSHSDLIGYPTVQEANITITVDGINDGIDENMENSSFENVYHHSILEFTEKTVLLEEATGTWCSWCVRGIAVLEYIEEEYEDDFITIAVHGFDIMEVEEYIEGTGFGSFPTGNFDRAIIEGSITFDGVDEAYDERKAVLEPATISGAYTVTGQEMEMFVAASFFTDFSDANFKFGVIMVEDDVTGEGAEYNQNNAYAGGGSGPMGGYEDFPDPIPAEDIAYQHVARALVGGYNGVDGSIPAIITDGGIYSYSFSYTVPEDYVVANMYPVAVIIDGNTGQIVNAAKLSGSAVSLDEVTVSPFQFDYYPNPATDNVTLKLQSSVEELMKVNITDLSVRVIYTTEFTVLNGVQFHNVDLTDIAGGTYIISVSGSNSTVAYPFVVK